MMEPCKARKVSRQKHHSSSKSLDIASALAPVCKKYGGWKCGQAYIYGERARAASVNMFGKKNNPRADAFRHVMWHSLMVWGGLGADFTNAVGVAWESFDYNDIRVAAVDLANNSYGRKLGSSLLRRNVPMTQENVAMFAIGLAGAIRKGVPTIQYLTG